MVEENRGSGGMDGQSLEAFEAQLGQQLDRLHRELKDDAYRPLLNHGLRQGSGLWSVAGQNALQALPLSPYTSQRRNALLSLYTQLQKRIQELDKVVEAEAESRPQACRLLTHPGVGPVTALATEVFLGDPN